MVKEVKRPSQWDDLFALPGEFERVRRLRGGRRYALTDSA